MKQARPDHLAGTRSLSSGSASQKAAVAFGAMSSCSSAIASTPSTLRRIRRAISVLHAAHDDRLAALALGAGEHHVEGGRVALKVGEVRRPAVTAQATGL